MSEITIDQDLNSGDRIEFFVQAQFFGYPDKLIRYFKLKVPKAVPIINTVDIKLKKGNVTEDYLVSNYQIGFSEYRVVTSTIGGPYYQLKLKLGSAKRRKSLKEKDTVQINSDTLTNLTGNYKIIQAKDNNTNDRILWLKIPSTDTTPANSGSGLSLGTNKVVEVESLVLMQKYTVTVPKKDIFDNLIKEISTPVPTEGNVHDVLIFSYRQFDGRNIAGANKKLMIDDTDVNNETPPSYADIDGYKNVRSYEKNFVLQDGENVICYVAIARYIYKNDEWVGSWLQLNQKNRPIWARAA